jgi:hypothetical protein
VGFPARLSEAADAGGGFGCGRYDADRGMVVVLLRTAAMLGDGAKDEAQARAMAQDLDKVFLRGAWVRCGAPLA